MRRNPIARVGWSPLGSLWQLQDEFNRAFEGARALLPAQEVPALSVWSNDEGLRITAEVPGLGTDDVQVSIEGDRLTISGTFPGSETVEGFQSLRRERRTGAFTRTIELPFRVDAEGVDARLENGVLELRVPRAEDEKPRRIQVHTS